MYLVSFVCELVSIRRVTTNQSAAEMLQLLGVKLQRQV